jgi:hypothetical protein
MCVPFIPATSPFSFLLVGLEESIVANAEQEQIESVRRIPQS